MVHLTEFMCVSSSGDFMVVESNCPLLLEVEVIKRSTSENRIKISKMLLFLCKEQMSGVPQFTATVPENT